MLVECWEVVFKCLVCCCEVSFFSFGGDSLLVICLLVGICECFGVCLGMVDFYC